MAELLKLNVTAADIADADRKAHLYKKLAQHLKVENWQIEITVADAEAVTDSQLKALERSISTMKASTDQLDQAVKDNAPDPHKP